VIINFEDNKLEKLANDFSKCQKELGLQRAKLFNRRLQDLWDVETLEDMRHLPGHYHELTGDRKGQWSCSLDQPFRLVFRPLEIPIPTDADGRYIWSEIKGVIIIEIVNYHGK
jgi:proteic killer suppression protein